jgi:hypothetical protein
MPAMVSSPGHRAGRDRFGCSNIPHLCEDDPVDWDWNVLWWWIADDAVWD